MTDTEDALVQEIARRLEDASQGDIMIRARSLITAVRMHDAGVNTPEALAEQHPGLRQFYEVYAATEGMLEAICEGAEQVTIIDHTWDRTRGTLRDWLQETFGLHYVGWEKRLEDLG